MTETTTPEAAQGQQVAHERMVSALFLVTAYRWGARENHSYTVGLFANKAAAIEAAEKEEDWRGGKYECDVVQMGIQDEWKEDIEWKTVRGEISNLDPTKRWHCGHPIEPGQDGR